MVASTFFIMNESEFNKLIHKYKLFLHKLTILDSIGANCDEFFKDALDIIDSLFFYYFGDYKSETILWYLYEYEKGNMKIFDTHTQEEFDLDQEGELWRFIQSE
jgi:hypothetical protein